MNARYIPLFILMCVLCVVTGGCNQGMPAKNMSQYHTMDPSRGWDYGDTLHYVLADSVATPPGNLIIGITHTGAYGWENLWLEITYPSSDSVTPAQRDTLNITLADKYGRWIGSGAGTSVQLTDTIAKGITLSPGEITLRNIMRQPTTTGIEQIGLIFVTQQ